MSEKLKQKMAAALRRQGFDIVDAETLRQRELLENGFCPCCERPWDGFVVVCKGCGGTFETLHRGKEYCSEQCSARERQRRHRAKQTEQPLSVVDPRRGDRP